MIERLIFVKLQDDHATDDVRIDLQQRAQQLFPTLPGVVSVAFGRPADAGALAAWDLCLRVVFKTLDDVESYRTDARHRAFVDDVLAPKMAVIKAWNFDIPNGD